MTQRTDTASEIKSLGEELSHLSAFVDKALTGLLRFMQKGDPSDVMPDEGKRESIQEMKNEIEVHCIRALVHEKGQPKAARWVTRAIITATLLEGSYQHIVLAMENVSVLKGQDRSSFAPEVIRMAYAARRMLRESVKSFLATDEHLARKVMGEDPRLDRKKEELFERGLTIMIEHPETLKETMRWIIISKHLERVGDHASHIAEEVLFLARD